MKIKKHLKDQHTSRHPSFTCDGDASKDFSSLAIGLEISCDDDDEEEDEEEVDLEDLDDDKDDDGDGGASFRKLVMSSRIFDEILNKQTNGQNQMAKN